MTELEQLLLTISRELVEKKEAVTVAVDAPKADGLVVYRLHVAPEDMGRVIGKQGKIAKAIRTLMRAGASKHGQRIAVEIE